MCHRRHRSLFKPSIGSRQQYRKFRRLCCGRTSRCSTCVDTGLEGRSTGNATVCQVDGDIGLDHACTKESDRQSTAQGRHSLMAFGTYLQCLYRSGFLAGTPWLGGWLACVSVSRIRRLDESTCQGTRFLGCPGRGDRRDRECVLVYKTLRSGPYRHLSWQARSRLFDWILAPVLNRDFRTTIHPLTS